MKLGEVCESVSITFRRRLENIVLINTSDVLDGRVTNHAYVPNENLRGQFKKTFQQGDILYSEIRPKNRRVAFVDFDASDYVASTKLMVIRANERVLPRFLFQVLKSENITNQLQLLAETRSGTFPQITFSELASLDVHIPSIDKQREIAATLQALDDKIASNTAINHHLEQMAQAAFERLLIEECSDEPMGVLSDIAEINPPRFLKRGQDAVYVEMANLPTRSSFPTDWAIRSFSGGMKFTNGDTIMARITPCLENGKTAFINFLDDDTVAFGSTEYIVITSRMGYCNEMFYFLARHPDFVSYAVRNMNGSSGRQRVSGDTIGRYELHIPPQDNIREFAEMAIPIMAAIRQNALENRNLAALRDALLPKLMSGELSVADLDDAK